MVAPTVEKLGRVDGWVWENILASCYKGVVKRGVLVYN